ncbi:hypothetical protein L2E82_01423 [Cichorium intybus]|uniref:Uncharacterized protein n=1 Tax=Cichorium intybus TaxID=13427 RepID=A0ACB9H049_CICIN|nr:hypothetical protein L2E82_01423 [Cichorium intybus]
MTLCVLLRQDGSINPWVAFGLGWWLLHGSDDAIASHAFTLPPRIIVPIHNLSYSPSASCLCFSSLIIIMQKEADGVLASEEDDGRRQSKPTFLNCFPLLFGSCFTWSWSIALLFSCEYDQFLLIRIIISQLLVGPLAI